MERQNLTTEVVATYPTCKIIIERWSEDGDNVECTHVLDNDGTIHGVDSVEQAKQFISLSGRNQ